jgi:hypothetical protein
MKFLITGGARLAGQSRTVSLLENGHTIRILDKKADLLQSLGHDNLKLVKFDSKRGAVEGIDVILHLAWSFSDNPIDNHSVFVAPQTSEAGIINIPPIKKIDQTHLNIQERQGQGRKCWALLFALCVIHTSGLRWG